jgi:hypothetical protein
LKENSVRVEFIRRSFEEGGLSGKKNIKENSMKGGLFSLIRKVFVGKKVKNAQLIQAAVNGNLSAIQAALADGAEINAKATMAYLP